MLVQGKMLNGNSDLSEVFEIRKKVFVEELNISENEEFDEYDLMSMHVIVYEEYGKRKPVAAGRIYYDGIECNLGHIAVLQEYRKKGYGDLAVRMLLNKAFTSGIQKVYCEVLPGKIEFFEKIGFNKTNNENKNGITKMIIQDDEIMTSCKRKKLEG